MRNYWIIGGVNEKFKTLKDAKYFIYVAYTPSEYRKYMLFNDITHYVDGKAISYVIMRRKNDKPKYSKIISLE